MLRPASLFVLPLLYDNPNITFQELCTKHCAHPNTPLTEVEVRAGTGGDRKTLGEFVVRMSLDRLQKEGLATVARIGKYKRDGERKRYSLSPAGIRYAEEQR